MPLRGLRGLGSALAGLAVIAGLQIPAGVAFAAGTSGDRHVSPAAANTAVSVNTTADRSVFNLSFNISRATGPTVTVTNLALAVASCVNCQTVAIAVQVVLVSPVPQLLAATNASIAANTSCVACETFAAAFQYVVATSTPLEFTRSGRRMVIRIEHGLAELRTLDLTPAELVARVSALASELAHVLDTQLVATEAR